MHRATVVRCTQGLGYQRRIHRVCFRLDGSDVYDGRIQLSMDRTNAVLAQDSFRVSVVADLGHAGRHAWAHIWPEVSNLSKIGHDQSIVSQSAVMCD